MPGEHYFPESPTSPLSRQETLHDDNTRHWSRETEFTSDDSQTLLPQHGHSEVTVNPNKSPKHDARLRNGARANRHAPKEVVDCSAVVSKVPIFASKKKSAKNTTTPSSVHKQTQVPVRHQVIRSVLSPTFTNQKAPNTTGARAKRHQPKERIDLSKLETAVTDKLTDEIGRNQSGQYSSVRTGLLNS